MAECSRGRREHDPPTLSSQPPKNIEDEIDQYFFAESELNFHLSYP